MIFFKQESDSMIEMGKTRHLNRTISIVDERAGINSRSLLHVCVRVCMHMYVNVSRLIVDVVDERLEALSHAWRASKGE